MAMLSTGREPADRTFCWCCGQEQPPHDLVHLDDHPEVGVCLGCAHFLHQQAWIREDARRPSAMTRVRDGMRSIRELVTRHGLHRKPVFGPVLRWLGSRLP